MLFQSLFFSVRASRRSVPGLMRRLSKLQSLNRLYCLIWGAIQWSFRKLATMGTPKLSAEGAKFEATKAPSIERRRRENRSAEGTGWGLGGVSPPQPTRGLGERRKLPQRGPRRSPGRQRVLPYFRSRKHLFGQKNAF